MVKQLEESHELYKTLQVQSEHYRNQSEASITEMKKAMEGGEVERKKYLVEAEAKGAALG